MHPPASPRGLRDRLTDCKKILALELPGPVIGDLPRAPVPLRISDLTIFEGLGETLSTPTRDIADLFGGWTKQPTPVPVSLREFLDLVSLPAPIPQRMLRDQAMLNRLIRRRRDDERGESDASYSPS